jgi:hypothetical protein
MVAFTCSAAVAPVAKASAMVAQMNSFFIFFLGFKQFGLQSYKKNPTCPNLNDNNSQKNLFQ